MIRSALLAATAAAALLPVAAHAQQVTDLGEIVVSGGLSPIAAARYGRAASVITAQDIEERGIVTVQDALRDVPGVSINGSGISEKAIRIRGGEANHTLVLIDGIEAAGGDSAYQLGGLDVANIERIEVLRGPQSAFYGSSASAGVVNIITRTGGEGTTVRGSIATGDATVASGFVARRDAQGGVSLALSHIDDRGFDVSGDGGERDGLRRSTAILSGDYLVTDDLKLGATLRWSKEHYEYDSTPWPSTDAASSVVDSDDFADRREATGAVFAEYSMLDGRIVHRLAVEGTRNDFSANGGDRNDARRTAVKYRLSYGIDGAVADADHLMNLLVERQRDSSSVNPEFNREATSVALEYRATLASGLNVQAGARFDDNETFDDATSWNVGLSYTLANGVRLHGSAGTGVVNPQYIELFDAYGYVGNPALTPERNRSFDIGAELAVLNGRGILDVTYFRETLTDEIKPAVVEGVLTYVNQPGDSDREGVEVTGTLRPTDALSLRLAYTYLDATEPDGSIETRRPRHELALGGTLQTFGGRGTVSADLRHVADNYDTQFWTGGTTAKLPDFTTLDVAATYDLTDRVRLSGRIDNLFDQDTTEVWGYATRGRAIYVGLDARF